MQMKHTAVAALAALAFSAGAGAAPTFHLTDLGTGWYQYGFAGLNKHGDAAGTSMAGEVLLYHADTGVVENKGSVEGSFTTATGLNDRQVIVGYTQMQEVGGPSFAMTGAEVRVGTSGGWPMGGINDAGFVAGMANSRGVLVDTRTGAVTPIGALPGTGWSQPAAISADNAITGFARLSAKASHAFYARDGQMFDLGALMDGGSSSGRSVNASGVVVGSADFPNHGRQPVPHAFIATVAGGMHDLLPDVWSSEANGVNAAGHVVGEAEAYVGGSTSFYYDGTVHDLASLVDASGAGWTLYDAFFINDADQVLGSGIFNGEFHAYLLTPVGR